MGESWKGSSGGAGDGRLRAGVTPRMGTPPWSGMISDGAVRMEMGGVDVEDAELRLGTRGTKTAFWAVLRRETMPSSFFSSWAARAALL
jgi:hypothetical protein